jgi:chloramphenicol O-acetyltransferase type A
MSYLDFERWARRDTFDYFRGFDKPFFNVCVRLDAAPLRAALTARGGGGLGLACYFVALRLANEHEAFRYRIEGERVRVHAAVDGSTTVLRDDGDSFGFADLDYVSDFDRFVERGRAAIETARRTHAPLDPRPDDTARIHFTTLPWLHFTSFSHARNWGREDSVPKFAFGRADSDGTRLWLPLSVEVHHALMDGLHVGRFVQDFEPAAWLPARA